MDASRVLFYGLWGGGVLFIFTIVLIKRASSHGHHHDRRSFRDLLEAIGLWLVALVSSLSVAAVVFFPTEPTMRGLLTSLALGAFLGVGIIMATEETVKR